MLKLSAFFGNDYEGVVANATVFELVVQSPDIVLIWANGVRIYINVYNQETLLRNLYGFLTLNDAREFKLSTPGELVEVSISQDEVIIDGATTHPIRVRMLEMLAVVTHAQLTNIAQTVEQFYFPR